MSKNEREPYPATARMIEAAVQWLYLVHLWLMNPVTAEREMPKLVKRYLVKGYMADASLPRPTPKKRRRKAH